MAVNHKVAGSIPAGGVINSEPRRVSTDFSSAAVAGALTIEKNLRCPGIEPGPSAWKADILTTRPTTPAIQTYESDGNQTSYGALLSATIANYREWLPSGVLLIYSAGLIAQLVRAYG